MQLSLMMIFRGRHSVLKRDSPEGKTNKDLKKIISQGGRERICNCKLPKVNASRKWRSEILRQEEACLKFVQAEENFKAI